MKVLYIAGRWDPRLQDEYSGNDFGAFHAIEKQTDIELSLVGPFDFQPNLFERGMMRLYQTFAGKRLMKYPLSYPKKCALVIKEAMNLSKPDLVFSRYSAPLAEMNFEIPLVYMCDSIVPFAEPLAGEFSKPAYRLMEQWEKSVIDKASRVVTYSHANAEMIVSAYGVPGEKVKVIPIPAFVPSDIVAGYNVAKRELSEPLRLLFVGKRPHLRGVDIAIEIVQQLNAEGTAAELRIVGMKGQDAEHVHYMGVYKKEDPKALIDYFGNFMWAQLLLHPSRFHAAGMVISEAAAFGLPTITNRVGGLATTVLHEKTGLVLPAGSPASAYCVAIKDLVGDPVKYKAFCQNARQRFETELNWGKAGEKLVDIIRQAAEER